MRSSGEAFNRRLCPLGELLKAFLEVLFEFAWKGPGYFILRSFRPNDQEDPDGWPVFIVGTAFWLIVALATWGIVVLLSG